MLAPTSWPIETQVLYLHVGRSSMPEASAGCTHISLKRWAGTLAR